MSRYFICSIFIVFYFFYPPFSFASFFPSIFSRNFLCRHFIPPFSPAIFFPIILFAAILSRHFIFCHYLPPFSFPPFSPATLRSAASTEDEYDAFMWSVKHCVREVISVKHSPMMMTKLQTLMTSLRQCFTLHQQHRCRRHGPCQTMLSTIVDTMRLVL